MLSVISWLLVIGALGVEVLGVEVLGFASGSQVLGNLFEALGIEVVHSSVLGRNRDRGCLRKLGMLPRQRSLKKQVCRTCAFSFAA